jgi:peptidoglycan/LPS O-acetylase OafA/YrhL
VDFAAASCCLASASSRRAPRTANIVLKASRHIPSLDGIRAISFLLVFAAHAGLKRYVPGGLGVTIFFFLSGFLITTLMRDEYDRDGSINFRHFWLRRILRILPPFYLVLILAVVGSLLLEPPGTIEVLPVTAQMLHYSNYWIIEHGYPGLPPGTGVYWSLAVEEHFYLLFPWLYSLIRRLRMSARAQAVFFWSLCLLVLLWRCLLVFAFHVSTDRTYMATDTRVDSILFGCALAVWCNPVRDGLILSERRWKYVYTPGALMVFLGCLLVRDDSFRETLRYSLQGAALTVLFVAAIRYDHWAPFRLLNTRLLVFIGLLSYSLYLLHYVVIAALMELLPAISEFLRAVLALGVSTFLAWLIYRAIEKPCAALRRRLTD